MTPNIAENALDKLDFKRVLPIFVIVLVDLLGLSIIIPLLPLYAASYGANALVIGILSGVYPMMQFVSAPILGQLSDRFGRRPVLIASQIGTFIGFTLMGFAGSLPVLLLARAIDGISGGNISTAQAVLTDSTTEKNRTQALGLIGAAFGLGFTIGPVLAFLTLSVSGNNYHAVAFVAAAFSLLSILLTVFLLPESLPIEKRGKHQRTVPTLKQTLTVLGRPNIGFLLVLMFAQQFVFGGLEYLLPLFTLSRLGMSASGNAILFVFIGVISVIVLGGLIRVWSAKHGDRWIILLGLSTLAAGMILTAVTPRQPAPGYSRQALLAELSQNKTVTALDEQKVKVDVPDDTGNGWLGWAWIFVAIIPIAIGGSVLSPTINSAITKLAQPTEIGTLLGTSTSMSSAANALTPIIGGALFYWFGSTLPFLITGLFTLVLLGLAARRITASSVPVPQ